MRYYAKVCLILTFFSFPYLYALQEEDEEFVYLALSYCPHTLHNVIEQNLGTVLNFEFRKGKVLHIAELDDDIVRILRELVTGVAHLHTLNIGTPLCPF